VDRANRSDRLKILIWDSSGLCGYGSNCSKGRSAGRRLWMVS
jgi:hypothetical protein